MIDAPAPASYVGVPSVRTGTVPFVSCRAGAYGRLLLATHERMMTGGLVIGFDRWSGSSNQRRYTHCYKLTRLLWWMGAHVNRWISCHFVVDLGAHTLISLVVRSTCVVFLRVVDLSNCSDRIDCVGLVGRLYYLTVYPFGIMYAEQLILMAFDDRYCMNHSNDVSWDSNVDLTSLGVVTLDATVIPDVFRLHAFDTRVPVLWVLSGNFSNMVRVLVLDGNAKSVGFHDVILENV